MDCYILLVSDTQDVNVLVSSPVLAKEGDLVKFAGGNIGEVKKCEFFTQKQHLLICDSEGIFPAEMLYSPNPLFIGGGDDK